MIKQYLIYVDESHRKGKYFSNFYGGALVNYAELEKISSKLNDKKQLKELNNKTDELQNKSNEINNIIDSLKPALINKNNFTISSDDIDNINYIEQTNDTTSNMKMV